MNICRQIALFIYLVLFSLKQRNGFSDFPRIGRLAAGYSLAA